MATKANSPKAGAKKVGRPSGYSPEIADKICALIREGYSERQIAKMEGFPSITTIGTWKDLHPEFLAQSAHARRVSAQLFDDRNAELTRRIDELIQLSVASQEGVPRGVMEGFKLLIQENNRQASIRDDSRYGDRRTVKLEAGGSSEGLKTAYAELAEALTKAPTEGEDGEA